MVINLSKLELKLQFKNQDFTTSERNQVWVYLATVIDLYNREVIGYAVSKKINAELAKQALVDMAKANNIKSHYPMVHENRSGVWSYTLHISINSMHIKVRTQ